MVKRMNHIGSRFISGFVGTTLSDEMLSAVSRGELGGVIWFKRNIESLGQVARENARLKEAQAAADFIIGIDQEGGRVQRLGPPFLQVPPMLTLGEGSTDETEDWAYRQSLALGQLNFNLNFAPVLDVFSNPNNTVIGDRAFGRDPQTVMVHATAFAEGMRRGGIMACAKHFPGHGDTWADSHTTLPAVELDDQALRQGLLEPFRTLLAQTSLFPTVMTAHVVYRAWDEKPATLSKNVLDILRKELSYQGVIISDDLEMGALKSFGALPRLAHMAFAAGCDKALICSDYRVTRAVVEHLCHTC